MDIFSKDWEHTKVLGHGVGLEGEGVELVGVDGKLLLDGGKRLVVNEEEDLKDFISIGFSRTPG